MTFNTRFAECSTADTKTRETRAEQVDWDFPNRKG